MNDVPAEPLQRALKLLAQRDLFEQEIRQKLQRTATEEEVESVLAHLRRRRIVDDCDLTRRLVAQRTGKRATGKEKIRAELLRRGAPEEQIDAALQERGESDEDLDGLVQAKQAAGKSRIQVGRFLASRGYEADEIDAALDRFFPQDPG